MLSVTHIIALNEKIGLYPFSGAENHLFVLMENQARKGYHVEFIPLVFSQGPVLSSLFKMLTEKGIVVRPFSLPAFSSLRLIFFENIPVFINLKKHLCITTRDIIHTHLDHGDYFGRISGWLSGCKAIVSTNHNNEPYYKIWQWKVKLRILDIITNHYIAISQVVKDHLVNTVGIQAKKITTIYYGIPPKPTKGKNEINALKQQYCIDQEGFIVGFIGRLEPQKNLAVLINAVGGLDNICCIIIGAGSEEHTLKRIVENAGFTNIRFLGHIPDASNLMTIFDIFCLPSIWEGLGLVLLEAMFQKIPIVGSTAGAIPEILGGGKFGFLFNPNNEKALRQIVIKASKNKQLLNTLADKAFDHAQFFFTTENMTNETEKIYQVALK